MEIAVKDNLVYQLECEINNRKQLLLQNFELLKKNQMENGMLGEVYDEYQSYYNYIIKMNEDKKILLENLNKYLDELILGNQLTEEEIMSNKIQQKQILSQLDNIRDELNQIVGKVE
jgi:hypothetical protein